MITSQSSQPSASISARLVGRKGAVPKRLAQYARYAVSGRGATDDGFGAVRRVDGRDIEERRQDGAGLSPCGRGLWRVGRPGLPDASAPPCLMDATAGGELPQCPLP